MAWRRPGDKPLSEKMMVCFTDAYMRHPVLNELMHLVIIGSGNGFSLVRRQAITWTNAELL